MKITRSLVAVLIPAVLCISVQVSAQKKKAQAPAAAQSTATQPSNDAISRFQQSNDWNKLTPSAQQAWLSAMQSGNTKQRLECFVKVRDLDNLQGDESFLDSKGFDVRMWGGAVARGHVNADDLPAVAGLPFVDSINLAQ